MSLRISLSKAREGTNRRRTLTRAAIEQVIKQQQAAPSVSCVEEETRVEEAERVVFNVVSLEVEGSATQRRH